MERPFPRYVRDAISSWADEADLSGAELKVLAFVSRGHSNKQIAAELGVADTTVRSHVLHLCRKLDARSRGEVAKIFTDQVVKAMTTRIRELALRLNKSERRSSDMGADLALLERMFAQLPCLVTLPQESHRLQGWNHVRSMLAVETFEAIEGASGARVFSIRDEFGKVLALVQLERESPNAAAGPAR